ncbi:phosphotransferase [Candidatus Saccharibacteria bacterium]|nr:phosphotransferase [Candidatus Saccharibacteria bacterium]
MYQKALPRALQAYGIQYSNLLPAQKGYRNESYPVLLKDKAKTINLIFYKRDSDILERIKNANRVSEFVADSGMPARQRADERILTLHWANGVGYVAVYNYLPGQTIPWEAYTQKHLKLLGKTMSDMHSVLSKLDQDKLPNVAEECMSLLERMNAYFESSDVARAMQSKLQLSIDLSVLTKLKKVIDAASMLPAQQPLHMDFVRSNILFNTEGGELKVTGIIDFEKAAFGHPVFDVARTLAFLLVDCKYKDAIKARKYFLYSGYAKRGAAKLAQVHVKYDGQSHNLREELVKFFLIHDFYKFLRHNPYEFLAQNEHFVRTQEILLQLNVINYCSQRSGGGEMTDWKKRLVSQSDLIDLHDKLKEKDKKIVFTAGSWDLIHAGQCRYLERAKADGDVLVAGVSSNEAIRKVKGANKPILDEKIRAEMLTFLRSVDFVTILPEPSCAPSLAMLKPDVYITVKEDWTKNYKESKEYKIVTRYGGKVKVVPRQSTALSTTSIVQRAIGGHLGDVFKDFMTLRKDPLKEKK